MKLRMWVDIAEIVASVAVVATLGLLVLQIKQSNEIEGREAALRIARWDAEIFLASDQLPAILSKIKAVDGYDLQPWMDTYDLSYAEAAVWARWLNLLWRSVELSYQSDGPSEELAQAIRRRMDWPDQRLFINNTFYPDAPFFSEEFNNYVIGVIPELQ